MFFPDAVAKIHFRKNCLERRIFGGAGIDARVNIAAALGQMTNAHLLEFFSVERVFYAIIGLPSADAVPNRFDGSVNIGRRLVRISVIGDYAAEALNFIVLEFRRGFQPVFAVEIDCNAALIKAVLAVKLRFYDEREIPLFYGELQHGRVIVLKTVVSSLP